MMAAIPSRPSIWKGSEGGGAVTVSLSSQALEQSSHVHLGSPCVESGLRLCQLTIAIDSNISRSSK